MITREQLELVDETALNILKDVGVAVPHGEVRDVLGARAGVTIAGEIVRFEPSLVREHTQDADDGNDYFPPVIAGAYSLNYLEPDADRPRPANRDDLVRSIKQADALGMGVCSPVVPRDVPAAHQEILMERLTHEYARDSLGSGQATSAAAAEASLEMHRVIGRPRSLELWVNSPLKMDAKGLDIIWKLRHLKPNVCVTNVAVRGQSAPIFLSGLLAQSTAECFAGMTLIRLLNLGGAVTYRHDAFGCYSVDMQSGTVLLSAPDYLRLSLLRTTLARHHGVARPSAKALLTQAKLPGTQAAMEKAAQSIVMEMAGAHCHMAAGVLACDEIFSPIQLMIDSEILSWISAATEPVHFSEDELSLDLIAEVGPGGTFFDHPSTAAHVREVAWRPELFSMNSLSAWLAEGMPTVLERARDKLSALHLSDEPVVSADVQQELAGIADKFMAR